MHDKKLNIMAILLIVVIGFCLSCAIVTSVETTKFDTEFMEGNFVGHVDLTNDSESFMHSYTDSEHDITYNISTVDDTVTLMEIYKSQGMSEATKVKANGNEWNVYFTKAMTNYDNNMVSIVVCQIQDEKQGYLIYAIFDEESYKGSFSVSDESFTQYVQPLLDSIKLKESSNVPKLSDELAEGDGDNNPSSSTSSDQTYWASSNSNKFHYPSCEWAQKISGKNKVVFHSRDEAINSGFEPCQVCGP